MTHITIIAGARPNFVKIAPIIHELEKSNLDNKNLKIYYSLVHTGQHYDKKMSGDFFSQLNIPEPHFNLACGGGTQAEQTGKIMIEFEKYLLKNKTDLVLVVGDVNSTMSCAVTAKKMNIKLAHVEAGIRSYDMSMPEEINRIVTDSITDYFFTTTKNASNNLLKMGNDSDKIFLVGNTMIDSLIKNLANIKKPLVWDKLNLKIKNYIVLTLHRPSNVDNLQKLNEILKIIDESSGTFKIIFTVHPRTKKMLNHYSTDYSNIHFIEPLSYLEFIFLVKNSFAVITDSGGISEETSFLNVPCLTMRENTERPETVEIGTNELVGNDFVKLKLYLKKLMNNNWKSGKIPEYWDGETAERIVKILNKI